MLTRTVCILAFFLTCFFCLLASAEVRQEMLVSTTWLADNLNRVVIIHVSHDRTKYDISHIPGARYLDWKEIAITREGVPNELPPLADLVGTIRQLGIRETDHVILYDDESGIPATRAYFALDYTGVPHVSLLNGQFKKWAAEKRPVSKEVPDVAAASAFAAGPRTDILVPFQTMSDLVWTANKVESAKTRVLDARPEAEYSGEKPGEDITRPGHIPGAHSLFWMKQVAGADSPVLLPENELRELYEKAGVHPGDTVITYCRTGGQSSFDYFVAKYLGYNARMYDGSFLEWSSKMNTQVETSRKDPAK